MKSQPSFITQLAILTTITCLVWAGLEIYRALNRTPPPQIEAKLLTPLNPEINLQELDQLKTRLQVQETFLPPAPSISPTTTPTPTSPVTLTPSPTPSTVTPTP